MDMIYFGLGFECTLLLTLSFSLPCLPSLLHLLLVLALSMYLIVSFHVSDLILRGVANGGGLHLLEISVDMNWGLFSLDCYWGEMGLVQFGELLIYFAFWWLGLFDCLRYVGLLNIGSTLFYIILP